MSLTVYLDDREHSTPTAETKSKPSRFALFQKNSRTIKQTSRNSGSDDVLQLTPAPPQSDLDTINGDTHSGTDASCKLTNSGSPQTTHHTLRTGSPDMTQMMQAVGSFPAPQQGAHPSDGEGLARGDIYSPRHPSVLREASIENSYEVGAADDRVQSKEPEEEQSGDQVKPALADLPALQFILRKDLYSFLSSAGVS